MRDGDDDDAMREDEDDDDAMREDDGESESGVDAERCGCERDGGESEGLDAVVVAPEEGVAAADVRGRGGAGGGAGDDPKPASVGFRGGIERFARKARECGCR